MTKDEKTRKIEFIVLAGTEYAKWSDDRDNKYLVLAYDMPKKSDLKTFRQLVVDFEKRFFRNVERGAEVLGVPDIERYIEDKQRLYDAATGSEKELEGGMLRSALVRRMAERALAHLDMRIDYVDKHPDLAGLTPTQLQEKLPESLRESLKTLEHAVGEDYGAAYSLPALRLNRGQLDKDDVLGEMPGEVFKFFQGSLPGFEQQLEETYALRYGKIADAQKSADEAVQVMAALDRPGSVYHKLHIQESLEKEATLAKQRMQLMRSEPTFHETDNKLRATRNTLGDAMQPDGETPLPRHLPKDRKKLEKLDPIAALLVKNAVALIYDNAMLHAAQPSRVRELKTEVQSVLAKEAELEVLRNHAAIKPHTREEKAVDREFERTLKRVYQPGRQA